MIEKSIRKTFSPEFINRIDEMIVFNSLTQKEIHSIIDIALESLLKRIQNLKFELEITDAAKDFVGEKGYDPEYGARPLHRAIQKWLEDPLAEELLSLNAKEGDILLVDRKDKEDKLTISLKGGKEPKKSKKDSKE